MIQMCRLKALNQVLITFCQTTILECTLKVVGHFASWSHCARARAREVKIAIRRCQVILYRRRRHRRRG